MEYTIKRNEQFNSLEITFDGKPAEAVRDALKALRFRWHGVKKLWYGYTDEQTAKIAIDNAAGNDEQPAEPPKYEITTHDGYMGAIAWKGNNSGKFLYGSELSQAIRDAIKGDGIKGVTVSVKTFSLGQEIRLTFRAEKSDFVPLDDYISATNLFDFKVGPWIKDTDAGKDILTDDACSWDSDKINRVHQALAEQDYNRYTDGTHQLNPYHIDDYKMFRPAFLKKIHRVRLIMNSFNHDDSNSMVDYFDRGFYEEINVKAV